jgi:hypothetical protein
VKTAPEIGFGAIKADRMTDAGFSTRSDRSLHCCD